MMTLTFNLFCIVLLFFHLSESPKGSLKKLIFSWYVPLVILIYFIISISSIEITELTLFYLYFSFRVFMCFYVVAKTYWNAYNLVFLQIMFLTSMLFAILIYFSLGYYFAFLHKNNLQIILGFILIYLSVIGIFFYQSYCIIWANNLDKEVPWTFFKDCLLPLLLLFIPLFSLLSLNIFNIWFHKIVFLIGLHICFIIPFLTFWNKYRGLPEINQTRNSWKHSQVYIHIALAMIYPLIFGLYFSFIRYLRLGEAYDIRNFSIFFDLDFIIFAIFLLPLLLFWLLALYIFMRDLRVALWSYTTSICYSIHIKMLKYHGYFFVTEKLFKLHYLYYDIISLNPGGTTFDYHNVTSKTRKLISYIYFHPFVLTLIFFSSLLIELVVSKGVLYYGLYTLFYYPLIFGIMRCFNLFSSTQFIKDVCMSDYINLRVINPRYNSNFWRYFTDPEFYYGFVHDLLPETYFRLNQICTLENKKSTTFERHRSKLLYRVWGCKYVVSVGDFPRTISFVTISKTHKWSIRVAGAYLKRYNARWFHTSLPLYAPKVIGKPEVFARQPFFIANWLNHKHNYGLVQTFAKTVVWPANSIMYKNLNNVVLDHPKRLPEFLENNFVMTLSPITKSLGWLIGTYNPMIQQYGYPKDTMQMRSDALIKSKNFYSGIDQKNKSVNHFGRNQAIVIDEVRYRAILKEFLVVLEEKNLCSSSMVVAIDLLSKSCENRKEHLAYWSQYFSIFPLTYRPPLRLENTFDIEYLSDEAKAAYYASGTELQKFSDRIEHLQKEREIAKKKGGNFSEQALDIFADSELQRIFGA
jgi:hypothetical protein